MSRLALIDADILPYEIGCVFDETTKWSLVRNTVDSKIEQICEEVSAEPILYLTATKEEGGYNYRYDAATVMPYKGHRTAPKPYWWNRIREHIKIMYRPRIALYGEADDAIAIDSECIDGKVFICSRDKDLDTVPGFHYSWPYGKNEGKGLYHLTEYQARYFFFYQMLIGDSADNIPGIYGVGKAKAERILGNSVTIKQQAEAVLQAYVYYYGDGYLDPIHYHSHRGREWKTPEEIMYEQARLLWIGEDISFRYLTKLIGA